MSTVCINSTDIKHVQMLLVLTLLEIHKYSHFCTFQVIYIGVQGKLLKNLFTVIIWDRVFNEESYTTMVIEGVADRFVFNLNSEVSIPNTRYTIAATHTTIHMYNQGFIF